MLTLFWETKSGQYACGSGLGLVRFHLWKLCMNITQRNVKSLSVPVKFFCIGWGVCHRRSFCLKFRQLLWNFLEKKLTWGIQLEPIHTSCSAKRCFRHTSASKTAWRAGVSSPVIYITNKLKHIRYMAIPVFMKGSDTSCSTCRIEIWVGMANSLRLNALRRVLLPIPFWPTKP